MVSPRLSIIVPTFDRPKELRDLVYQLLHQRFSDFEILIVDQSDDPIILNHDTRINHYHIPLIGPVAGTNEGISRARGEIVLILNDDVVLHDENKFLDWHLAYYISPNVGGVGGRIVDRVWNPNTRKTQCRISVGGRTVQNLTGIEPCFLHSVHGANMSFRAKLFEQVGLFDTDYNGTGLLAETDFATRVRAAGWKLIFAPEASLLHLSAPTGGVRTDLIARECSRFRNTGYYLMKHRGFLGLVPFVPTSTLISIKRTWQLRNLRAMPRLLRSMVEGIRAGQNFRKRNRTPGPNVSCVGSRMQPSSWYVSERSSSGLWQRQQSSDDRGK